MPEQDGSSWNRRDDEISVAGRGGLGVTERFGLVRSPSLVSSAVDAMLPVAMGGSCGEAS